MKKVKPKKQESVKKTCGLTLQVGYELYEITTIMHIYHILRHIHQISKPCVYIFIFVA